MSNHEYQNDPALEDGGLLACGEFEDTSEIKEVRPFDMAQLRAILDVVPAYHWCAAPSGALTFVNKRAAEYMGISDDHPLRLAIDVGVASDNWAAFVHPDDLPAVREYWASCLRACKGGKQTYRIRGAQGGYRWFTMHFEPIRTEDRALLLWIGASLDVEELKRTEDALRRTEAYLTDAQSLTHTGSWAWDPNTRRVIYCSDEMFRIFGLSPDVVPSRKTFRERVHPDDRELVDQRFQSAMEKGGYGFDEYRILLPDGTSKHICSIGHLTFNDVGTAVAFVGTAVDVTERKNAENALREGEYKLRQIVETVPGLIWSVAPGGELTHVNRRLLDYSGMRFDEFKHRGWTGFVHPADRREVANRFDCALQNGTPYQDVIRLRRADGEFRWHDVRCEPLRDSKGSIIQWYGLSVDIDDRTQALARLQQLQADFAHMNRVSMMGELAASLSHEITQPIASARNNACAALNFFAKDPPNLAEISEALACVVTAADRAGQIVDRIRDQTRKAPPRRILFDLNQAINEVIALARTEVANHRVSIETRFAAKECFVQGDRVQLQQVVMNLILNAIEAMSAVQNGARELVIGIELNPSDGVLVTVSDSGPGVRPEDRERVFEPFYTTKSNGGGMGLSICRSIIDAHEGRLWVNANWSAGTAFQFTIPVAGGEAISSDAERQHPEEPPEHAA
jgi:PAS domain S-box-containing protein